MQSVLRAIEYAKDCTLYFQLHYINVFKNGDVEICKEVNENILVFRIKIFDGVEIYNVTMFQILFKLKDRKIRRNNFQSKIYVETNLSHSFSLSSRLNERRSQQEPPHKIDYLLLTYFLQLFNTLCRRYSSNSVRQILLNTFWTKFQLKHYFIDNRIPQFVNCRKYGRTL